MPAVYKLFIPKQAVGANLVYFDFFNVSTSGWRIELESVLPVVSGAVAHTGVLAADLHLTRTTDVGTGGTAATAQGTDTTAATFTHMNGSQAIDLTKVSARLTPTGGATAGAWLAWRSVFTEETNAGTYTPAVDMVDQFIGRPGIPIAAGTGIRVVQGAVAATGNIGFDIAFSVYPR